MKQTSAIKGHVKRRTRDEAYNEIMFPHGLLEIHNYTLKVITTSNSNKKIIIEIHRYKGFALIKFYPFHLKKNKNRYEYRGEKQLGYSLSSRTVFYIIHECILVMRDYLEENPNEFVGYVGQVDSKDNIRKREQSQRTSIYNRITSSIFEDGTIYKISSKKIFKEINLRLIRKIISKQENKLTKQQMENYNYFLNEFKKSPHILYTLMTETTREKVLENL
ncbi:MAG: hypothetical protein IT232_10690 [Flavobacteriales bacterium]|nr:hypothetical protein [Flavobacteriales bacterium]